MGESFWLCSGKSKGQAIDHQRALAVFRDAYPARNCITFIPVSRKFKFVPISELREIPSLFFLEGF